MSCIKVASLKNDFKRHLNQSAAPGIMATVEIRCVLYGARMCEPRPGPSV